MHSAHERIALQAFVRAACFVALPCRVHASVRSTCISAVQQVISASEAHRKYRHGQSVIGTRYAIDALHTQRARMRC